MSSKNPFDYNLKVLVNIRLLPKRNYKLLNIILSSDFIKTMEDIHDINDFGDVLMLNQRREMRVRGNFVENISDLEFKETFRFTKHGVAICQT